MPAEGWQVDSKTDSVGPPKGNRVLGFCHFCHAYELVFRLVKGEAQSRICRRCLYKRRETGEIEPYAY